MLDGKEQGNGSATTGSAAAQKARPKGEKGEKGEKDESETEKERMRMNLGGAIISEKPNVKVRHISIYLYMSEHIFPNYLS